MVKTWVASLNPTSHKPEPKTIGPAGDFVRTFAIKVHMGAESARKLLFHSVEKCANGRSLQRRGRPRLPWPSPPLLRPQQRRVGQTLLFNPKPHGGRMATPISPRLRPPHHGNPAGLPLPPRPRRQVERAREVVVATRADGFEVTSRSACPGWITARLPIEIDIPRGHFYFAHEVTLLFCVDRTRLPVDCVGLCG